LQDVWPSPGWYTILVYTFLGALAPDRILPAAKFTLRPSLAFSYIGSVTARHSSTDHQPNCGAVQGMELRNFSRGRHLYSAARPSRWASARILVDVVLQKGYINVIVINAVALPTRVSLWLMKAVLVPESASSPRKI